MASVNIRKNNGYYAVVYNFKTLDEAMQNVYRHFEGRDLPGGEPKPSTNATVNNASAQITDDPSIPTLEETWVDINKQP